MLHSFKKKEGSTVDRMKKIAEEKTKELLEGFDSLQKRVNHLSSEVYSSLGKGKRRSLSKNFNPDSSNRSSMAYRPQSKLNSQTFTTKETGKNVETHKSDNMYELKQNEILQKISTLERDLDQMKMNNSSP